MERRTRYLWEKAAAEFFFPRRLCAFCDEESFEAILCPRCQLYQRELRTCAHCAAFLSDREEPGALCPNCRTERPPYRLARAALPYTGLLRHRLLRFKYQQDTGERRYLAPLLIDVYRRCFRDRGIDAVTPIPLSPWRFRERGYNQAELLTDLLTADQDLPHRPELLRRVKDTRRLAELGPEDRRREMENAFLADPAAAGRRVLLVDDIFTTGATAASAARSLLNAGAEAVYVLTVAAGWATGCRPAEADEEDEDIEAQLPLF